MDKILKFTDFFCEKQTFSLKNGPYWHLISQKTLKTDRVVNTEHKCLKRKSNKCAVMKPCLKEKCGKGSSYKHIVGDIAVT